MKSGSRFLICVFKVIKHKHVINQWEYSFEKPDQTLVYRVLSEDSKHSKTKTSRPHASIFFFVFGNPDETFERVFKLSVDMKCVTFVGEALSFLQLCHQLSKCRLLLMLGKITTCNTNYRLCFNISNIEHVLSAFYFE